MHGGFLIRAAIYYFKCFIHLGSIERFIRDIFPSVFKVTVPIALIGLSLTVVVYWKSISDFLKTYKDSLIAFSSIVTAIGFLYAIFVSYIKFFAGRLFTVRAQISVSVSQGKLSEEFNLHLIRIILKNPGSLPLRVHKVNIKHTDYFSNNTENKSTIEDFDCIKDHVAGGLKQILVPGQDSVYYVTRKLSKNAKIVVYEVIVKDFLEQVWTEMTIIENNG